MLDRHAEDDIVNLVAQEGVGLITFSPLAQGLLSDRYLNGIPAGSRMTKGRFLKPEALPQAKLSAIRRLNDMALQRGQSLAAMALEWNLRQSSVTSVLVGASSVQQLDSNLLALDGAPFLADELLAIDDILNQIPLV